MWKTKTEAFRLRHLGQSYQEISAKLGIPKTTLSGWFKHEPWSADIRTRLVAKTSLAAPERARKVSEANKRRWATWHKTCQQEAIDEFPRIKDNPLFLAAIMLYWSQGDQVLKNGAVRLKNNDPEMIKLFHLFLVNAARIPEENVHVSLLLYPDLVDSVQKNFWSRATGIPTTRFKRSTYIKGHNFAKRLSYGVCSVYAYNRALKEKIIKWQELYRQHLLSIPIEKK